MKPSIRNIGTNPKQQMAYKLLIGKTVPQQNNAIVENVIMPVMTDKTEVAYSVDDVIKSMLVKLPKILEHYKNSENVLNDVLVLVNQKIKAIGITDQNDIMKIKTSITQAIEPPKNELSF